MAENSQIQLREENTVINKIALFMDYDNMLAGNQMSVETFSFLFQELLVIGTIEYLGIYTDVRFIANAGNNSYDLLTKAQIQGFKVIHCPKLNGSEKPKDTVDEMMVNDVYDFLEKRPDINIFVFATHDRDFLPVINRARQHRKTVILVINSPEGNKSLQQVVHKTIRLEVPCEKPPAVQVSDDIRTFLNQPFESPSRLIDALENSGLVHCRDLKISLDVIIAINSMKPGKYGFKYYLDYLKDQGRFAISGHFFDEGIIRGILSVLIDCNILKKEQSDRVYYILDRAHIFVQVALNEGLLESVQALF